jgi:hypothetical protein
MDTPNEQQQRVRSLDELLGDPHGLRPVDVRRAVLGVLFRAGGGPLSIGEIVRRTATESGLDLALVPGVVPRQRVSDILRHQVRVGRAEVTARGEYRLLVRKFSRSTEWRSMHWRVARAERVRRYRSPS